MDTTQHPTIQHDVSLKARHTFGLDATADKYIEIQHPSDIHCLLDSGKLQKPFVILGGGSNMLFPYRYHGTVVHIATKGIRVVVEDEDAITVSAAAGELWDDLVRHCVAHGWHGLENMAAIPGTVGAAPVQNVGAYGVEAKDYIERVFATDITTGKSLIFTTEECHFGYRDSIFKNKLADRCIITEVWFRLSKTYEPNLAYKSLMEALKMDGLANPSARQVYDTVTRIRWDKLPRPEDMGSAGSFFKNPIISPSHYNHLKEIHPDLHGHKDGNGYKVSAAWLIEQCGWKGRNMGRCGVYVKQPLVLVNLGGCTFDEVRNLSEAIMQDVEVQFDIPLEREALFSIA